MSTDFLCFRSMQYAYRLQAWTPVYDWWIEDIMKLYHIEATFYGWCDG